MAFWHIQLHPDDPEDFDLDDLNNVLDEGIIGMGKGWNNDGGVPQIFKNKVGIGDIILVRHKGPRALVKVTGECRENDTEFWFGIIRNAEVLSRDGQRMRDIYQGEWNQGLYLPSTFQPAEKNPFIKFWYNEIVKTNKMNNYRDLLLTNKNLVLTGAPGTGKTFLAKEIAKEVVRLNTTDIKKDAFTSYHFKYDEEYYYQTKENWNFWKSKIMSSDFSLDDFTSILQKTSEDLRQKSGYLMNFLERGTSVYGSSKPGNAFNYGLKLNVNNTDYSYLKNGVVSVINREDAKNVFETEFKPFLRNFLTVNLDEQIKIVDQGNEIIKASQLLKKIIVLEHPEAILSVYQSDAIIDGYKYYISPNSKERDLANQSKKLLDFFIKEYKLPRNEETQLRVSSFIWKYFSKKSEENIEIENEQVKATIEESFNEKYFNEYISLVQFHPSYDYTDFVEGLRPFKEEGKEIGFKLKNGVFKSFCAKALTAYTEDFNKKDLEKRKFVFIIDEINRGELSKIFGELFYSIDPGYRGSVGSVKTQYHNINAPEDFVDSETESFYIPKNFYIIGTMNDIDRSVESIDFAMRRRFAWIEIKPEDRISMWDGFIDKYKDDAKKKMNAINEIIKNENSLGEHYQIGPSYFLKLSGYQGDFTQLWDNHIAILIKEYLRGTPNSETIFQSIKTAYYANN